MAKKDLRPAMLHHVPPQLDGLMEQCWHPDFKQRPAFDKIIKEIQAMEEKFESFLNSVVDPSETEPPKGSK